MIIVVVGPSGVGKSTFIKAMDLPSEDYVYGTCQPMIEELIRRGVTVTHDTIFALSEEWCSQDPYWQITRILAAKEGKRFLVVDGPRRLQEMVRLRTLSVRILVVKITSEPATRFQRLKERKRVSLTTLDEFQRLETDELSRMGLGAILNGPVDIVVRNSVSVSIRELETKGRRFGWLVKILPSCLPKFVWVFLLRVSVSDF